MEIVFSLLSLFLIGLGFVIRQFKVFNVIAGYDASKIKDGEGLAKWVGTNLIFMGLLIIGSVILTLLITQITSRFLPFSFLVIIVLLSIRTAFGCKKFEK